MDKVTERQRKKVRNKMTPYWCMFCSYRAWYEVKGEEFKSCPRCGKGMFVWEGRHGGGSIMSKAKNIFRHKEHNVYCCNKRLVLIQRKNKIKFWFGGLRFANFKFFIYPNRRWQYFHWLIMLPFIYCEKNNGGFKIGLPNLHLWRIN
jgi:ribosomal protein S27AE